MPEPDKKVTVFLAGNKPDWNVNDPGNPGKVIHLNRNQSVIWQHSLDSLSVEFPNDHPFTKAPPFEAGPKGMVKATVRDEQRLKGLEFPCRVTLDNRTKDFTEYGVIIDD